LAAELLPPDAAADAVSHVVSRGLLERSPPSSISFTGRPLRTEDGFCRRRTYYVPTRANGEPNNPVYGNEIRLGSCEGLFAYLNPGTSLEKGKTVLRHLAMARTQARGTKPLPFTLTCSDQLAHGKCDKGARSALADLPLENATIVTGGNVSVVETAPGQVYWDVTISDVAATIALVWKAPAPF
jgi:hypothetical protein